MAETFVQTQVRHVLEKQCRETADLLASKIPAGTVFLLVLADIGDKGNMSYVSSCERESAVKLLEELLGKWRAEQPFTPSSDDCPCCQRCLAPGLDTDRALVIAYVSGLAGRGTGLTIGNMLCPKHARLASEAAAFVLERAGSGHPISADPEVKL